MATTKYRVITVNAEGKEKALEGTKSKRATAVELARETRAQERVGVRVETEAGKVVFEMAAPKKIKMSPRYTRVQELPEGAIIPEGHRVAYNRARKNLAITHDANATDELPYAVVRFTDGEVLERTATTREAGAFCKTVPVPAKAEPEPADA
jgi:hypothetical protein